MTYTHTSVLNNVHTTRILPLNHEIVRVALLVHIPDYRTIHSDSALQMYAALAHTGTAKKSKLAFLTYLRKHGISLDIRAGRGTIQYMLSVRKENVPYAVALLTEILFSPTLNATEYRAKKQLLIEANRESQDDAKRITQISFNNILYPKGTALYEQTINEALTEIKGLKEIKLTLLHTAIKQGEWFISFVGDTGVEKMFAPLIDMLRIHAGAVTHPPVQQSTRTPQHIFTHIQGKTNVEIRLGNNIPITPLHEDYMALSFGIDILGKVGGFAGRLMKTVREKEGLTYGIYAALVESNPENTIHFTISTFFTAKDLEKGLTATKREITKIVAKGITPAELKTFKDINYNQYLIAHESNQRRLSLYHRLTTSGYSEEILLVRIANMQRLTARDINRALKAYIDQEKLVISGAGPVTTEGIGIL